MMKDEERNDRVWRDPFCRHTFNRAVPHVEAVSLVEFDNGLGWNQTHRNEALLPERVKIQAVTASKFEDRAARRDPTLQPCKNFLIGRGPEPKRRILDHRTSPLQVSAEILERALTNVAAIGVVEQSLRTVWQTKRIYELKAALTAGAPLAPADSNFCEKRCGIADGTQ